MSSRETERDEALEQERGGAASLIEEDIRTKCGLIPLGEIAEKWGRPIGRDTIIEQLRSRDHAIRRLAERVVTEKKMAEIEEPDEAARLRGEGDGGRGVDGPAIRCAKCASSDVWTRYCDGRWIGGERKTGAVNACDRDHDGEILHRVCRNCQNRWDDPTHTPPSTDRSGTGDVQDFHDHSPEMKADHEHPATPDPDDGQEGEGRRRVESLTVEKVRGRYRLWECPCPDCENLYLRVPSGPCPECGQNLGSWDGVFVDRHPQDEGVREARSPFTKRGEDPADQGQIVDAFKECHRYHIDQHGEDYPPKATLGYFLDWIREVCQPALRALDADRSEEADDG